MAIQSPRSKFPIPLLAVLVLRCIFLAIRPSASLNPHRFWVPWGSLKINGNGELSQPSDVPGTPSAKLYDLNVKNPVTAKQNSVTFLRVGSGPLSDFVKFNFSDLDEWLEEDSQIVYHPRDPYHRIDILPSSRKIRIEIDGVVLADNTNGGGIMSLWETGFPGRWYLPRTAV